MTPEEIDAYRSRLIEFKGRDYAKQVHDAEEMLDSLGLSKAAGDWGNQMMVSRHLEKINTHLQTEMMRIICESAEKSCKSAEESSEISRKSCRWAAIAAIASGIGAIASLSCAVFAVISMLK